MTIYKTAAMSLLTGILGSGKTIRAVQLMDEAVKADEKVYQSGFKGLTVPGVIDWEDPRKWQELPSGAILFVDEAQKWFGERRQGYAPDYLKAMNTMRGEEGVRMVLLTQHPKYLDSHIKDLVGCHEHLLRESGKASSKLWRSDEIMEDPRSPRGRSKADQETFRFPLETAAKMVVSANSDHTIKYRMPSLVKKAILIGGSGALLLGGAWFLLFRNAYADANAAKTATAAAPSSATPTQAGRGAATNNAGRGDAKADSKPRWELMTQIEWDRQLSAYSQQARPRFASMPWTAPMWDDRAPTSDPQLLCMSSGEGVDARGEHLPLTCTCLTEQGTPYEIEPGECRRIARRGPEYNPYLRSQQNNVQAPPQAASVQPAPAVPDATVIPNGANKTQTFPETPGYQCETCGS